MAVTAEDVLIRFVGEDQVSPSIKNIAGNMRSLQTTGNSTFKDLESGTSSLSDKFNSLTNGLNSIQGLMASAFGIYGVNQIYQQTVGVAALKEGYSALIGVMSGSKEQGQELMNMAKEFSYKTPFMFRDFAYGLTLFESQAKLTTAQTQQLLPEMADIAQIYQLKGMDPKSGFLGLSQAMEGNFRSLRMEAGITSDKLKDMGWSGDTADVQGFIDAMDKLEKKMGIKGIATVETYNNELQRFYGQIRSAESGLGELLLPGIEKNLQKMIDFMQSIPKGTKMAVVAITGVFLAVMAVLPWLPAFWGGLQLVGGAAAWAAGGLTSAADAAIYYASGQAAADAAMDHAVIAATAEGLAYDVLTPELMAAAAAQDVAAESGIALAAVEWGVVAPLAAIAIALAAVGYLAAQDQIARGNWLSGAARMNRGFDTMNENIKSLKNHQEELKDEEAQLTKRLQDGNLSADERNRLDSKLTGVRQELKNTTDKLKTSTDQLKAAEDARNKQYQENDQTEDTITTDRTNRQKQYADYMLSVGAINQQQHDQMIAGSEDVVAGIEKQKNANGYLLDQNDKLQKSTDWMFNDEHKNYWKNNTQNAKQYNEAMGKIMQNKQIAATSNNWWHIAGADLAAEWWTIVAKGIEFQVKVSDIEAGISKGWNDFWGPIVSSLQGWSNSITSALKPVTDWLQWLGDKFNWLYDQLNKGLPNIPGLSQLASIFGVGTSNSTGAGTTNGINGGLQSLASNNNTTLTNIAAKVQGGSALTGMAGDNEGLFGVSPTLNFPTGTAVKTASTSKSTVVNVTHQHNEKVSVDARNMSPEEFARTWISMIETYSTPKKDVPTEGGS